MCKKCFDKPENIFLQKFEKWQTECHFWAHVMLRQPRVWAKQKSYKWDRLRDSWLTGITRPASSCNLVTLSTNFAQYNNFVWSGSLLLKSSMVWKRFYSKNFSRARFYGFWGTYLVHMFFSYLPVKQIWRKAQCESVIVNKQTFLESFV